MRQKPPNNYIIESYYKIYEISEDGLLKDPKDIYGDSIFSWINFKTEKAAEEAILNSSDIGYYDKLVIIKHVKKFY